MRQKPGPAPFGKPAGLSAARETTRLVGSQVERDPISKGHLPGCRLRPSDSKT